MYDSSSEKLLESQQYGSGQMCLQSSLMPGVHSRLTWWKERLTSANCPQNYTCVSLDTHKQINTIKFFKKYKSQKYIITYKIVLNIVESKLIAHTKNY